VAHTRILPNADYQEAAGLEERACVHARPVLPRVGALCIHTSIGQDRGSLRILEHKRGGLFVSSHLWVLLGGGSGGRSPPLESLPAAGG
jgi:hypothetical protein